MPSSVIRRFRYDEAARRLRLTFVSGAVYDYDDVPPEVAKGLAQASSKGRFFGLRVRDRYPCRRVFSARQSSDAPPGR
ncbi:KTSC domain-containing protein [Brevundimonas diminuta]|uniref:KTSC domain-containing protein n=1 Tax=Brevundimonas TaxID=41275 RepID=UPI00106B64D6|nr:MULTISPECIES: KTSC domain-containing protein [Brevundimonas]MCO8029501.1 KTSC domain-containing protein [Brevundimonas diminuta]QBQ49287.1 KTSC domain-containing protein [Brevundimonas naejangsanensis]